MAPMRHPQLTIARPAVVAVVLSVVLGGCGSSTTSRTVVIDNSAKAPPLATAQPAAITAPSSAPAYCKTLSQSNAVVGLSAAMDKLAQTPNDPGAHTTIRNAAAAFTSAARSTSGAPRAALQNAASALGTLDRQGLSRAGTSIGTALQNLGSALEGPCSFPVG